MTEQKKPTTTEEMPTEEGRESSLPDAERRQILGKLATCAFVAPLVLLVLDGGDSITYAY